MTLTNMQVADSGRYVAVVSNKVSLGSSSPALVYVSPPPAVLMPMVGYPWKYFQDNQFGYS
ncbi:MAG: hypothetical protein WCL50_19455, partial [Spirochaetota bacterium]